MVKSKSTTESEEVKRVAKALGIDDLDDDSGKKDDKESKSKKTDISPDEEAGRIGKEKKSKKEEKKEEEPDYKKMYSDSTKEFQKKYKPMEEMVKKLEELSGRRVDDIVKIYETEKEKADKGKEGKDAPKKGEEVIEKFSSLEERLASLEQKTGEIEEKDKLSAKQIIESFRSKYGLSEEDYRDKYYPLLDGIKSMRKQDGDPYTLEEGLELSYIIANKDNIDKIVESKIKAKEKEVEMAFAPKGKESSELKEEDTYSEQQLEVARRLGIDLTKEEEKK